MQSTPTSAERVISSYEDQVTRSGTKRPSVDLQLDKHQCTVPTGLGEQQSRFIIPQVKLGIPAEITWHQKSDYVAWFSVHCLTPRGGKNIKKPSCGSSRGPWKHRTVRMREFEGLLWPRWKEDGSHCSPRLSLVLCCRHKLHQPRHQTQLYRNTFQHL